MFGLGLQEMLCLAFMGIMVLGTVLLILFLVQKSKRPKTPEERDFDER